MPEYVRVRCTSTGHQKSIPANASRVGWELLDKPATNPDGTPLPDKHHVPHKSLSSKSLSSTSTPTGQKADNPKGAK